MNKCKLSDVSDGFEYTIEYKDTLSNPNISFDMLDDVSKLPSIAIETARQMVDSYINHGGDPKDIQIIVRKL